MSGSKCVEKYTYNVCYDFIWDIQPSKEACAKRCYENLEHCESWSYRAMRGPAAQYGGRCNLSASRCKETKPWYQSGPPYVWGTRECGNVDDHNNGKGVFKSMKYLSIHTLSTTYIYIELGKQGCRCGVEYDPSNGNRIVGGSEIDIVREILKRNI